MIAYLLACDPDPLPYVRLADLDFLTTSADAARRPLYRALAQDPLEGAATMEVPGRIALEHSIHGAAVDEAFLAPVLLAWWQATERGLPQDSAWRYVTELCQDPAYAARQPCLCAIPDRRWETCPTVRPVPIESCLDRALSPAQLRTAPATVAP